MLCLTLFVLGAGLFSASNYKAAGLSRAFPGFGAGLSGWVTDRLYEAGAEDSLSVAGDASMSVSDTGKWTALAVLLGVQFGAAAWGMLKPARVTIQGGENLSGNGKTPADRKEQKQKMMGLLTNLTQVCLLVLVFFCAMLPKFIANRPLAVPQLSCMLHIHTVVTTAAVSVPMSVATVKQTPALVCMLSPLAACVHLPAWMQIFTNT